MITLENEKDIEKIVDIVINRMKKKHLLKKTGDAIYSEITQRLKMYYKQGEKDEKIKRALTDLKGDYYISIIQFYYKNKYTIENIAEMLNVDVSTVKRNKKRLCMEIYLLLND